MPWTKLNSIGLFLSFQRICGLSSMVSCSALSVLSLESLEQIRRMSSKEAFRSCIRSRHCVGIGSCLGSTQIQVVIEEDAFVVKQRQYNRLLSLTRVLTLAKSETITGISFWPTKYTNTQIAEDIKVNQWHQCIIKYKCRVIHLNCLAKNRSVSFFSHHTIFQVI